MDGIGPVIEPFFMKNLGLILCMPFEYSIIRAVKNKMVITLKISMNLCFLSMIAQKFLDIKLLITLIFKVLPELDYPVNELTLLLFVNILRI